MRYSLRRPRVLRTKRCMPRRKKIRLRLAAAGMALLFVFLIFEVQLLSVIRISAPTVLSASVTKIINDAVIETLAGENTSYSELVTVHYDNEGKIVSLTYNNVAANTLRSKISADINTAVSKEETRYMRVPWGTLNGFEFMRGFGKGLKLEITQYGYVLTDIRSEFTGTGINQTRHSLILDVTVKVQGYITIRYVSTEVKTSIIIAETVIVGTVPNAFYGKNGNG